MDYSVYEKWVTKSFRWVRAEKDTHLPHHIQMLGIVDAELRGIRKSDLFDTKNNPISDENGILALERHQIKAHLWVLGAYELVRMIAQRLWEDETQASTKSREKVIEVKKIFERLRMPMAKLEASKRNKKTDFDIAYAGMGEKGLGWRVSPEVVIYQEELSDLLFEMFNCMWAK
ncbi:MAG: hypothetical protein OQK09_13755 [Colwellia sp.]|nr:hypothetical protein [Colwellia sp.]MCW8864232.1 hypothetical protein [Colwellia sp.]MCW9082572.1 hypothetical protein [Colwellia sp.]